MTLDQVKNEKEFKVLARPLVKFLNDNYNPHTEIIIDRNSARVVSGECSISITDYIKD